jgi:hypothetical protein
MLIGGGILNPAHPGLMRVRIIMSWNNVLTWSKYWCMLHSIKESEYLATSFWKYYQFWTTDRWFLVLKFCGQFITAWHQCTPGVFGRPVWWKTDFKGTFKCWGPGFITCRYCLREAILRELYKHFHTLSQHFFKNSWNPWASSILSFDFDYGIFINIGHVDISMQIYGDNFQNLLLTE